MGAPGFRTDEALVAGGWSAAYARLHREGLAEFPPACLHYVLELVRRVSHEEGPPGPAALTAAFRAATRDDFGPLRRDVLDEWGVRRPAALGRAVALLGHAGCLILDEEDAPAFYAADARAFTEDDAGIGEASEKLTDDSAGDHT